MNEMYEDLAYSYRIDGGRVETALYSEEEPETLAAQCDDDGREIQFLGVSIDHPLIAFEEEVDDVTDIEAIYSDLVDITEEINDGLGGIDVFAEYVDEVIGKKARSYSDLDVCANSALEEYYGRFTSDREFGEHALENFEPELMEALGSKIAYFDLSSYGKDMAMDYNVTRSGYYFDAV